MPLRPLTLLVGENSSGKSTFLAMVSAILDELRFPVSPGFNEPPYNLGTFDTIATYKGGKYGRDNSFSIGFICDRGDPGTPRQTIATYNSEYGNVVLKRLQASCDAGTLKLDMTASGMSGEVSFSNGQDKPHATIRISKTLREPMSVSRHSFRWQIMDALMDTARSDRKRLVSGRDKIWDISAATDPPYDTSFSFAPIRSKPKRTYDEFTEEYSPEGDHVPTLLARLLKQEPESSNARRVQKALQRFGVESGLFRDIHVKRLGKKASDPFQIQVRGVGPTVNLTDVGYGVSQALPIIVQSAMKSKSNVFLMQQPEVHLHPRAQAALGTFFCGLAANETRLFLIETHSDFLVDRVRQEVAEGTIESDKVLILFFHKPRLETAISQITVDDSGNIQNAPPHYRRFFLEEEMNLFTRTGA